MNKPIRIIVPQADKLPTEPGHYLYIFDEGCSPTWMEVKKSKDGLTYSDGDAAFGLVADTNPKFWSVQIIFADL